MTKYRKFAAKPLGDIHSKEALIMTNKISKVKEKLTDIIKNMAKYPWLFAKKPEKDFTRKRKLDFETIMLLLLSMDGSTLSKELLEYTGYSPETATASAFVQQRDKILPEAFEFLFHQFNSSFNDLETHKGYRLLAVDGSSLNIAHNPEDANTYFQSKSDVKGFNLMHLNAMYDIKNKIYVDAILQPGRKENENRALTDMMDRSKIKGKVIVMADRGYEAYNAFAHAEEKGWNYVIRVKDVSSSCGIVPGLKLKEEGELDKEVSVIITRKKTNAVKEKPELYKCIPKKGTFDFVDLYKNKFYPMTFRVVRFKITEDTYETLITNLSPEEFSPQDLKELYHMRWGIETSFRELKYAIGLTNFHAKKMAYIIQEVFARLVMYNFSLTVALSVTIKKKATKHLYQVNFTVAIQICKKFIRSYIPFTHIEALITKHTLPIRPDRQNQRKIKRQSVVSFLYRVA